MFNFNVPQSIKIERLNICKKCKWYNDGWCGTPIIGNTVEDVNDVTYYKEKIKLCGCKLEWKAKYRFTSCPARKWHALDWSAQEIKELDAFIGRIYNASKIVQEDNEQLHKWYSKMTGKRENISSCPSCIRELITEFRKQLGKVNEIQ